MKKSSVPADLHVVLIYGGQSAEHEVSLVSARNVLNALDLTRYKVTLVRIDHDGTWCRIATDNDINLQYVDLQARGEPVVLGPGKKLIPIKTPDKAVTLDVVFPVLHGTNGEDGAIQGLLQMYDIPCVGAGVLGSAICMDKDVSKRLLREGGIAVPDYRVLYRDDVDFPSYASIAEVLGEIFFVKPANTGSSVGISRVTSAASCEAAIKEAFKFDDKVLVEEAINGREIECAVLGHAPINVSICGEITTTHSFYSYEAKYEDEEATSLIIPAPMPDDVLESIQDMAGRVCRVLECSGMARVDFFLEESGRLLVNEVNTIPGFTAVSMYPLLWEHLGRSRSEVVDILIRDTFHAHLKRRELIRRR